jgi:hypothetical protein
VLAMRLLAGSPLGQASLSAAQADAVGGVFGELHEIRRSGRHGAAPDVRLSAAGMLARVCGAFARLGEDASTGLRREVAARWRRWRAGADCGVLAEPGAAVVFGQGDPNLSNCLWDSGRIRLVDFEYAGWSDPVYELALLIEHVQSRATSDLMWARVLQRYGLTGADSRRLWAARRLVAWFWVAELWPAGAADDDRFVAQAARATHVMAAQR